MRSGRVVYSPRTRNSSSSSSSVVRVQSELQVSSFLRGRNPILSFEYFVQFFVVNIIRY